MVQTQQFISLLVQVAVVSLPCDDFKAAWLSIPSLQELNSRSSGRLLKLLCMAASPSSLTSGLSVYCWLSWWPRAEYPTQVVTSHLMLCLVLIMLLHSRCKMSGKKPLISDKPGAALVWPLLSGISTTHWLALTVCDYMADVTTIRYYLANVSFLLPAQTSRCNWSALAAYPPLIILSKLIFDWPHLHRNLINPAHI